MLQNFLVLFVFGTIRRRYQNWHHCRGYDSLCAMLDSLITDISIVAQFCICLLEKEKKVYTCACSALYCRFFLLCILHYHSSHTNYLTYCISLANVVIQNKCQQQNIVVVKNCEVVQRKHSSRVESIICTVQCILCHISELSYGVCLLNLVSKVYPLF